MAVPVRPHAARVDVGAALRSLICPRGAGENLDRLNGVIGMDMVELGVIPSLVVAEDRHAELWLDDSDNIALYKRVWKTLSESAVYGADAHNLVNSARRAPNPRN
jgi:hypothetical protein